jgi:hypothetical protein
LSGAIAGRLRVEIDHGASGLFESEVLVFEISQRSGKQPRRGQQNKRERGLQDHQRFARKRFRPPGSAVCAAERLNGVDARGHPRRADAEGDAGDQGDGEGKQQHRHGRRCADRYAGQARQCGEGEVQDQARTGECDREARGAAQ